MGKPLKGFITYAHKNTTAKDELITRLSVMQQRSELVTWHDAEMTGGTKWREDIFKHLADSDILLYLVSAASLASENCNKELAEAISSDIRIIPIILEDCDWQYHQLSDFQAFPDKGKPINEWQPESKGWQNVVAGIRKTVEEMQAHVDSSSGTSEKELRAELAFQQGNVFMMLGQMDKAIERYSHGIGLNPNNAGAYNNRGVTYVEKGNLDHAIEDFNTVIDLKPNYAAYNNRGLAYDKKGDFNRAIEDYTKAIGLKPNYADTYTHRGIAYDKKGDYDRAIKDFAKVINLKPDYAGAYYNYGSAYIKKGDYDRAIGALNMAIDLKSDYADAYNNRASVYIHKGDYDRAIEDYSTTIKLKPSYVEVYNHRGIAYDKTGDFDRAIIDYNKVIKLKLDDAGAYNNRGIAYKNKGDFDRAIEDFNTAIELKRDYADAYNNRGNTYKDKGEYDRAIGDHTKAISLKPGYVDAYYNRGLAYGVKGDYDRAIGDFTKVIDLKSNDADAYNNRGLAYYAKGEFDEAVAGYTRVINLNPNHGIAYNNRGRVWLHLAEWDKARADLTNARDLGVDIVASFRNDYKSVEAYERANRVKLPEEIAAMLTQRRRSRYPKTEKFLSSDGTPLESSDVLNLLTKLRDAGTPLSQYIQTRPTFGLKIGRQEAFVVDSATREQLIAEHPASADILEPFLHGRDIRRWQVARPVDKSRSIGDTWLIFSYRRIEIDRYPAIRKHLEKYRSVLSKRAGKQKWYELPVAKSGAEHFAQTKLVCPNSYDHQTFAVDTDGFYCGDTCYLIPTEETWLCGLLNSRVVEWFYSQTSNQLTGDYLQARSRYMQEIPIPDLTSTQKAVIGKIVDYLIYLQGQPTTSGRDLAHARDAVMLGYFERIIDGLVYESYLREELHQGEKQFFKPLLDERLPHLEEIRGDKMSALQEIFERLYERTHPVRRNLFFLDSVKPIRIIEGKA